MNQQKINYFPEQDIIHLAITDEEQTESMVEAPTLVFGLTPTHCATKVASPLLNLSLLFKVDTVLKGV